MKYRFLQPLLLQEYPRGKRPGEDQEFPAPQLLHLHVLPVSIIFQYLTVHDFLCIVFQLDKCYEFIYCNASRLHRNPKLQLSPVRKLRPPSYSPHKLHVSLHFAHKSLDQKKLHSHLLLPYIHCNTTPENRSFTQCHMQ